MAVKNKDDGGDAFPSPGVILRNGNQQGAYAGMSLRDYFAAKAMQGMMAHPSPAASDEHMVARDAYTLADAMLEGRANGVGNSPVPLAEPNPYQPKGEWSFERCEDGAIAIRNGKDWTVIQSGKGPIYEQFLYRFCEHQMREFTAPNINENSEFEKWRNAQIESLIRTGHVEGAEAFRNLGSVQWAGWQARASVTSSKGEPK